MVKYYVGRFIIGLVLLVNLQSAFSFIFAPHLFAPAYELIGIPGETAVKGFGVLFVMWNIPYIVAFINPIRFRTSLLEAIAMQALGLAGESYILFGIPDSHSTLIDSILRFIIFDSAGLLGLMITALMLRNQKL